MCSVTSLRTRSLDMLRRCSLWGPRLCPAVRTDLLLYVSEEARCRKGADERLFGHHSRGTRRSGGDASDSRRLPRYLRRVLTLHHLAHAGGRSETIDLRACSDRLRHCPGQVRRPRNIYRQYSRVSIPMRSSAELLGRELPA